MRSSLPARAVSMITGMLRVVNDARSRLQTSTPSISGIITSSTIRSGDSVCAIARLEHGVAVTLEPGAEHEPDVGFVVRDQDALVRHHVLRCLSFARAHWGSARSPTDSRRRAAHVLSLGIGFWASRLAGFPA